MTELQKLPIDEYLPAILHSLQKNNSLVLSAEPGAGKTTRLPGALLELESLMRQQKKILVLEPRRIAAVSAASRIAEENGWIVGGAEVGYQVRFDSQYSSETRLIFLTEALLAKRIQNDPELSDVGAVILDEFHERSQHVDLAIGLLKELQSLSRPDLRIIVMSATLSQEPLCKFLETKNSFSVPGKTFPLEISYLNTSQKLQTDQTFIEFVGQKIREELNGLPPGEHLLVFLPGTGEIDRVQRHLEAMGLQTKFLIFALHGNLSLGDQKKILTPSSQSKIILSTNVAESSLTIDQVTRVIDTGLQRRSSINPKTGVSQLQLARISQSSATQRSGRAARQKPGRCLRLWSKLEQTALPAFEIPEIHRTDLTDTLLLLADLGVSDPLQFTWFEKPKEERLKAAIQQLQIFKTIDRSGRISELGKNCLKWPLSTRLSFLLEIGLEMERKYPRALDLACQVGALLSELRVLRPQNSIQQNSECDLIEFLPQVGRNPMIERVYRQLKELAQKELRRRSKNQDLQLSSSLGNSTSEEDLIRYMLFRCHVDRIAKQRKTLSSGKHQKRALMIGGRGLIIDEKSSLHNSEYFVTIDLIDVGAQSSSDSKANLVSAVDEKWLADVGEIHEYYKVEFDEEKKSFSQISGKALKLLPELELPIGNEHRQMASSELIQEKLPEVAKSHFSFLSKENANLASWLSRFQYFQNFLNEELLTEEVISESLADAAYGESSILGLAQKDLVYFFEEKLEKKWGNEKLTQFHNGCPAYFVAPTSSKIKIDYTKEKPEVEIRLQELFGQTVAPTIMMGQVTLTLVLLAPNYRPVQVTQDLISFWNNGYNEVKKELKARYPKHSWPENPLTAPPVAKGKSHK